MYKSEVPAELTEGAASGPVGPLSSELPPLAVKEWMGSADQRSAEVYMTNTLETRWRPVRPGGDQWVEETWRQCWVQDGEFGRAYGWVVNTPQIEKLWQACLCSGFTMGIVGAALDDGDGHEIIELIVPDATVYIDGRPVELHCEYVPVRDARK